MRPLVVNRRGVNPNRVAVIEGGNREGIITELWLAPDDASPPRPTSEMRVNTESAFKFDEVSMGVGCEPEFTLDLYELNDGLRFYTNVLRENPNSQAWIIIYPNRRDRLSRAARIASRTRDLMVRDFVIRSNRIKTRVRNRRQPCMKVEIWIAPAGVIP